MLPLLCRIRPRALCVVYLLLLSAGLPTSSAPAPPGGVTPLMQAVFTGQTTVCKQLLAHGADPNARNQDGDGPLTIAIVKGNTTLAALLLSHGAQVNARNRKGVTPLMVSAFLGRPAITSLLLAHGANPAAPTPDGYTPLMMAGVGGSLLLAQTLLQHGAPVDAKADKARPPCSSPPPKAIPRWFGSCWRTGQAPSSETARETRR